MTRTPLLVALLGHATAAAASDGALSFGLSGGAMIADRLDVLDDTLVIAPRVGYWMNPTLGIELDLQVMPVGQTRLGVPETFGYTGVLPAVNVVGRVFEDRPVSLIFNVGAGPFIKSIDDDGALGLPSGDGVDVDFAMLAGPGLLVPFGPLALRTEYRWLVSVGGEGFERRGDTFIGGSWTLGLMYLPTGPRDADKDGIPDEEDACIDQAEDFDDFEDGDGCPDSDNDGDGIADVDDACANDSEDFDEFEDDDGCPEADNDADGIADAQDICPNVAGTPETQGCPDADADGLRDALDECPDVAGLRDAHGCPDGDEDGVPDARDACVDEAGPHDADTKLTDGCPAELYIGRSRIQTAGVAFVRGKAELGASGRTALDGVAELLIANESLTKLEVAAHTHSEGADDENLQLSRSRAEGAVAYLVEKGVSQDRLIAKGYGESRPIADNETRDGREANERLELVILERAQTE